MLPLALGVSELAAQFRIEQVQVLNWGSYEGLETMTVGRTGTAILGPSGRGKSTLLDAIAAVIMPNPQVFNQAARDDRAEHGIRTVYTYARGLTDQMMDANGRSSTPAYLRPPGKDGFASGAAITWSTLLGKKATALRLVWVGPDDTDVDNPIYAFIHDAFDLRSINGLRAVRTGASPISKASFEPLIDIERGDIVDTAQSRVHAKMRAVLGMGSTEDSQRLALRLLRRAQASKGIFSINDLFRDFVLTEPPAMGRWSTAFTAYQEARTLYQEFEVTRTRMRHLEPLPAAAEKYREAGRLHTAKTRLLTAPPASPARIEVWHASKVRDWCTFQIESNRLDHAQVTDTLSEARARAATTEALEASIQNQITAAGGDQTHVLQQLLQAQEDALTKIQADSRAVAERLAKYGQKLPTSPGDLVLLKESLTTIRGELETARAAAREGAGKADAQYWAMRERVEKLEQQIAHVRARRSNIPDDAAERRDRIAEHLGLASADLPYAGELMQLAAEHRVQWEQAIANLVAGLARRILVPDRLFVQARRYLHQTDMNGEVVLQRVRPTSGTPRAIPGTVPALLNIQADSPHRGWLLGELMQTYNYWCSQSDTDFDSPAPAGTRGHITPRGMRGGAERVTKNDRRSRYTWLGWDTSNLRRDLEEERASRVAERDRLREAARDAANHRDGLTQSINDLDQLAPDLTWDRIDVASAQQLRDKTRDDIRRVDTPHMAELRDKATAARREAVAAAGSVNTLETQLNDLDQHWAELCSAQDTATGLLDSQPALTEDDLSDLASLPFALSSTARADLRASLDSAKTLLGQQAEQARKDRVAAEELITSILRGYRTINERTERETDGTIDSLPAMEALYEQLVRDDLPRAKDRWLAKVDTDLNGSLQTLLIQIREDGDAIRRGLGPINSVLAQVPFRDGATLSLQPIPRPCEDLKRFQLVVRRYTSHTLSQDPQRDADEIERSFQRLQRELGKLTDNDRAGAAWRTRVFDARQHVGFRAIETRPDGAEIVHDGVSGKSGGEGQELIAFILGAALRYRLGEGTDRLPTYGSIVLDEGFVKADSDFTGRSLGALQALGFQLVIGAPREKSTAFERHVDSVAYINIDSERPDRVRIYPMTIAEAMQIGPDY